jgi:hypothetical protein
MFFLPFLHVFVQPSLTVLVWERVISGKLCLPASKQIAQVAGFPIASLAHSPYKGGT